MMDHGASLLSCKAYHMPLSTKRGSLGYLKHNGPTNKDYWLSLGLYKEFPITVDFVFEQMEKMILEDRTMFVEYLIVLSCPTDNSGGIPRGDSVCGESLVCSRNKRIDEALRWIQCFVRLSIILWDLAEFVMCGQKGARHRVQCRNQDVYEVNKLSFLEAHLVYLYIHTI